jgi:2-amino-4-hydroxy-6-hydroxymethyldihydropteridine diphosphokinase
VTRSYIGLGSNIGDRLENLRQAVGLLNQRGIRVVRSSRVYETEPVGPPQPDYLNAVVEVETALEPRHLLRRCQEVEEELGRVPGERWGPRLIDLDVLTYDDMTIEEPDFHVPHPLMHERAFVMAPLLELDDDPPLPGGRKAADLRLDTRAGVRVFAEPLEPLEPEPGR